MTKLYRIPEPDPETLAAAFESYRLAVEWERRVILKWEPRDAELRKLDEFHRTRVAWENEYYHAEEVRKFAQDMLLRTAGCFKQLYGMDKILYDSVVKRKDRNFVRVLKACEKTFKLFRERMETK